MLAVALAIAAIIAIGCALYPRRGELSAYERRRAANRQRSADVIPISRARGWRTGV